MGGGENLAFGCGNIGFSRGKWIWGDSPQQAAIRMGWGALLDYVWVPNRGPEDGQTGFLRSISLRTRKTWFLKALSLNYQHCEDAIWLWKHRCFQTCPLCHFCRFCLSSYHVEALKTLQNQSLKGSKTIPQRSSMTYASWKRFWNWFGTILDSQMATQKRSLRRPRGCQKRILFSVASQEAARMDFEVHLDPLELDV